MSVSSQDTDPRLIKIIDCLYRVSAKAVIIENQKILLTLEHGNDWWSLPGGGISYGESIQEALRRELAEELGLNVDSIRIVDRPLFVTTHAVVDRIPRANVYYRVYLESDAIKATQYVKAFKWFTTKGLNAVSLSPSITKAIDELANLMQ